MIYSYIETINNILDALNLKLITIIFFHVGTIC